ncbi:MAG: PIN domain-containing protein [Mycobacteriales bacterium]
MRGLDTNVVVRYLTQDDPVQAKLANNLIESAAASGEKLHLDAVVLCELVWVLCRAYRFDKPTIVGLLDKILAAAYFSIAGRDSLREALVEYRSGTGDFADYVIGLRNRGAGCDDTITFDRGLSGSPLFSLV